MKKCPFCAEEIQIEAIKCKHCGEFLSPKPDAPLAPAVKPAEKWYFKTSVLVLLFACVGPFVLPLVWLNPKYSRPLKVVLTVILLALTLVLTWILDKSFEAIGSYYRELQSVLG